MDFRFPRPFKIRIRRLQSGFSHSLERLESRAQPPTPEPWRFCRRAQRFMSLPPLPPDTSRLNHFPVLALRCQSNPILTAAARVPMYVPVHMNTFCFGKLMYDVSILNGIGGMKNGGVSRSRMQEIQCARPPLFPNGGWYGIQHGHVCVPSDAAAVGLTCPPPPPPPSPAHRRMSSNGMEGRRGMGGDVSCSLKFMCMRMYIKCTTIPYYRDVTALAQEQELRTMCCAVPSKCGEYIPVYLSVAQARAQPVIIFQFSCSLKPHERVAIEAHRQRAELHFSF